MYSLAALCWLKLKFRTLVIACNRHVIYLQQGTINSNTDNEKIFFLYNLYHN